MSTKTFRKVEINLINLEKNDIFLLVINMNNEEKIFLSTNISYLRKKKRKSQLEMADDFGYSNTTISNWEKGTRIPESLDLPRIADYFNINIDELMRKDLRLEDENYQPIENKDFAEKIADILKNSNLSEKKKDKILSDVKFYMEDE